MSRLGCLLAVVAAAACSGGNGSPKADARPPDGFDRSAMLDHLARNVYLPLYEEIAAKAAAVPAAIEAYCDALDAGSVGGTQAAARAAWAAAVDAWQLADGVLVGPAAMDSKEPRDRIYAWPLLGTCAIDRDTVSSWTDPSSYVVSTKLVNQRSLTALEYLLHTTSTVHTCALAVAGWDALGPDLPRARCRQARAIAADVAANAEEIYAAWRPDGGDYAGVLAGAGQSGSSIPTAQAGINLISDGFVVYVDKMIKDMKLAETAGIAMNACGTTMMPCDLEVELRLSDRATFAIRANLEGFRRVFTGTTPAGEGPSFDDFLTEVGAQDVADRMTGKIDTAIAAAAALPDSFLTALSSNYPAVVATHTALRQITDDLKSQFLTLLALEIPQDVAGDND